MPNYKWTCEDCNVWWDREFTMQEYPDVSAMDCPKCETPARRVFEGFNTAFGDDKDYSTVQSRYAKVAKEGYDKTAADRWLRRNIKATKDE